MKKLRLKLCTVILIFALLLNSYPAFAWTPSEYELTASSAILMDTARGQVLYDKNADALLSPVVMCKLMTALIVIEKTDLSSKVTVSKNATSLNGASLDLIVGNKYTVEDLLYGIMLSPSNDAAMALAEYVGDGDVNKFVELMNTKAKELSLHSTFFVNPTGLYDENQFTSARDIAKLVKVAISNTTFNIIFGSRGIPWVNGKDSFVMTNQNKLFWSYEGVDGGKIGTNPKNTSTVTTATQNDRRLIAVVINADEEVALNETIDLFDYGFNYFSTGILFRKNTSLRGATIADIDVDLISKMDIYYTYPKGESYIENISYTPSENLTLPVTKDTIAGVLQCTLKDSTVIEVNLYPDQDIKAPENNTTRFKTIITENRDLVILVIILAAIECLLVLYHLTRLSVRLIRRCVAKK